MNNINFEIFSSVYAPFSLGLDPPLRALQLGFLLQLLADKRDEVVPTVGSGLHG